ncbi:MAG: PLAT/LH2 domain-containing protein [Gemmatimonadota bacterium]
MKVSELHVITCARATILLLAGTVGLSVPATLAFAQDAQTITNRWKSEFRFQLESVPGTEFTRLRAPQGLYVHIEQGPAKIGAIDQDWQSAMWTLEPASDAGFFRLRNRWKGTYLHVERGSLEPGEVEPGWHSAMWSVATARPVPPDPNNSRGPLRTPGPPVARPALFQPAPARLLLCAVPDDVPERYNPGEYVTVAFLSGSERLRERVRTFARTWTQFGNIHFDFIDDVNAATIGIDFDVADGHYSHYPKYQRPPKSPGSNERQKSMNIGLTDQNDDRELRRVIVHEFGHAIGFIHEQNQAAFNIPWDIAAVMEEYKTWTEKQIWDNVLNIYRSTKTQYDHPDPNSIMMYPVDNKLTIGDFEIEKTTELSAKDKETVARWYPYAAGSAPPTVPLLADYRVTITTGKETGSGTDADFYLTIHGALNSIIGLHINGQLPGNALENGAVEAFELRGVPNVGEILSVVVSAVRGDFLGIEKAYFETRRAFQSADNWYLESVKISGPSGYYAADFKKWLNFDDHSLTSDVVPGDPGSRAVVTVETGDRDDAGTDANVEIQLRGDKRNTEWIRLNGLIRGNAFERGSRDLVDLDLGTAGSVGTLREIGIRQDNAYAAADWYLQSVRVSHDGKDVLFNLGDWLKDNQRERTLKPGGNAISYRVTVRTGDDLDAGTDANITIRLVGSKGSTNEVRLNGLVSGNAFERGATDVSTFTGFDIGRIDTLFVRHDNMYAAAGWQLRDVVVEKAAERYVFPAEQWLQDNSLSTKLTVGAPSIEYIVDVQTSDVADAGTDANVWLIIHGDSGDVSATRLNGLVSRNVFERGNTDRFVVRGKSVGRISSIHIWHDNLYAAAGWHLASLRILRESLGGDAYYFQANQWLENTNRILLTPGKPLVDYRVTIVTGTESGAGTDANVSIRLNGSEAKSATFTLNRLIPRNAFENGDTDVVTITGQPDIGTIIGVEIWHDDAHAGSSWYLKSVKVTKPNAEEKAYYCNCWLEGKSNMKWLGVIRGN